MPKDMYHLSLICVTKVKAVPVVLTIYLDISDA